MIRSEEKAISEHALTVYKSSMLNIKREIDYIDSRIATSEKNFLIFHNEKTSQIVHLNEKKKASLQEKSAIKIRINDLKTENESLQREVKSLSGAEEKTQQILVNLDKNVEKTSLNAIEQQKTLNRNYEYNLDEDKIQSKHIMQDCSELRKKILKTVAQIDELKQKKLFLVEKVKRGVCKTIYDVLVSKGAKDLIRPQGEDIFNDNGTGEI